MLNKRLSRNTSSRKFELEAEIMAQMGNGKDSSKDTINCPEKAM